MWRAFRGVVATICAMSNDPTPNADPLEIARQLAAALQADARFVAIKQATGAVHDDPEAKKLEEDYAAAAQVMQSKELAGAAIEPDEKRLELELREKVSANTKIVAFLRAQADFSQLMNGVNEEIQNALDLE